MNLSQRSQLVRRGVLFGALSFVALFAVEVSLIFASQSLKTFSVRSLSFFIVLAGLSFVFSLHFLFYLSRKSISEKIIKTLSRRGLDLGSLNLKKLFKRDLLILLKQSYVFIPRFYNRKSSLDLMDVEGLNEFLESYSKYSDLDLLEDKKVQLVEKSKKFKFSVLDLVTDVLLFLFPFTIVSFEIFKSSMIALIVLGIFRVFSLIFYSSLYSSVDFKDDSSLKKIEVFLNADLKEEAVEAKNPTTRVDVGVLLKNESLSTFFLVDLNRKRELLETFRAKILLDDNSKHWALVTNFKSDTEYDLKNKNCILFFPSEAGISLEDCSFLLKSNAKILVVDSSPGLAEEESDIFYLDQDEKIKKVKVEENLSRLSGDKGLILRNLCQKKLDKFVQEVNDSLDRERELYLIFSQQDSKVEQSLQSHSFIYPDQGVVRIVKEMPDDSQLFCKINEKKDSVNRVKNFIANCPYHKVLGSKKLRA